MTAAAERVLPIFVPELPTTPSRLAQTRTRLRAAIQEHVRPFLEPAPATIPSERTVFQAEITAEQRAESEARFMIALAEKKKLRDAGDPRYKEMQFALVVGGGGMKGAASGAMLEILRDNRVFDLFDDIYTDSAGTANMAYLLGSDEIGSDTYIQLAKNGFTGRLPHKMKLPMLLQHTMDNTDSHRILKSGQNWYIGITDEHGQKQHILANELSDELELYRAIGISMSAPWGWNRGRKKTDGYVTGLSTKAPINKNHTNIMVLMNETDEEIAGIGDRIPLTEKIALPAAMWGVHSWDVIKATLNRGRNVQDSLDLLDQYPDLNITRLTSPHLIDWQTSDVKKIEKTITLAKVKTERLLEQHGLLEDSQTISPGHF